MDDQPSSGSNSGSGGGAAGEATAAAAVPASTQSQPSGTDQPAASQTASSQAQEAAPASQTTQTSRPDSQGEASASAGKTQPTPARDKGEASQSTTTAASAPAATTTPATATTTTATTAASTTGTRRNANGSVSSVYSGNRIRYLKKDDGQPFWRKDIQFLFLQTVFDDDTRVFTKVSTGSTGHTFAEIYIDAMAKSSKCSQVLKEKLMSDHTSAVDMAMICLLVNIGRMNTTLNFFPEMRARVRTYHAIPCLQARQGAHAYKQLQDGPRLKSILKGATEDTPQPSSIDEIIKQPKPRTNPVNLIFVFAQFAPKISELHFPPPREIFDLFMRDNLSSKSRAHAFLWLMWWYLESDLTADDALNNPFGAGDVSSKDPLAVKVPTLELLTDEQAEAENVDTEEELAYGEAKRKEREAITANEPPLAPSSGSRRSKAAAALDSQHRYRGQYSYHDSDSDGNRLSASPSHMDTPGQLDGHGSSLRGGALDPHATPLSSLRRGQGRGGSSRRPKDTPNDAGGLLGSEGAASQLHLQAGLDPSGSVAGDTARRKIRSHVTVEQQRRHRVDILLSEQTRRQQAVKRKERRTRGVLVDAWIKCLVMPADWDSDDDELHRMGGLDTLDKQSRNFTSTEDAATEPSMALGDAGDCARSIAHAARRISKTYDGVSVHRAQRERHLRRGTLTGAEETLKDGDAAAAAASSGTPIGTARMSKNDPRRKRPYRPRGKRNMELQPQTSRLDLTPTGVSKRKRPSGVKGARPSRGAHTSPTSDANPPGEGAQSMNDFLGAANAAGGDGDAEDKSDMGGSRADVDAEDHSVFDHDADGDGDADMMRGGNGADEPEDGDGDETEDMDESDELLDYDDDDLMDVDDDEPAD